ncbi:MAG: aminotransferase class I/II-fold pyridoxal phosphate-dependent enzyme [Ignavibacteriales bacterium]|nr:aminotransferase class I/II-fold pyridoxal phosphate-dependent enzyme [Ignavibacteriales bacterium]
MSLKTKDMPIEEFRKHGHELIDFIADYFENIEEKPVLAQVEPGEIKVKIPKAPPEKGENFESILNDVNKIIIPGMTHWNHPNFMAYFNSTASAPAILGDFLSSAFNINGMIWKTSPASTELEEVVLDWFRQMLQLPKKFFGIIYDLASVSSMHAIAAAREQAKSNNPEFDISKLKIYCSEHAHSSIEKGVITLGMPITAVVKIKTDDQFRMLTSELEEAINEDKRNNFQPFCIVATVGTTSMTSIDPIDRISQIARKYNLWLHVDAAHAGSAAIVPEIRPILSGIEDADSMVVNPHKWLFVPIDLSVLFTSKPETIKKAFSIVPEYLKTDEESKVINYMDFGIQLGRKFRSLKLWFLIRYFGVEGLQNIIREHIRLGELFADFIDRHPNFERLAPTPLSTICFRAIPNKNMNDEELNEFNKNLMNEINSSGKLFLSHTKINGKFTIRITIGGIRTEEKHILNAWELIQEKFKYLL